MQTLSELAFHILSRLPTAIARLCHRQRRRERSGRLDPTTGAYCAKRLADDELIVPRDRPPAPTSRKYFTTP